MAIPEEIQKELEAEVARFKSGDQVEVEETEETEEITEELEEHEEVEEETEEGDPPGFVPYEDWVAQGKDPDDWRGKNAFKREYERIQKNRESESKNKELLDKMDSLVNLFESEKQTAVERARAEERERFEREVAEAKENMDVDRLEELYKNKPDTEVAPQEFVEPEPIANFRKANPIIDPSSPQFDVDFEAAMTGLVNNELSRYGSAVNETIIKRVMDKAYKDVRELFPEKFESPKNNRKTVSKTVTAKKSPRFQNVEFSEMGGQVKGSSAEMLHWFEKTYGKDHPTTLKFKKSMEA